MCIVHSTLGDATTPYTERYATHLLDRRVGIRHIQELLGHYSPETTRIYAHLSRIDLLGIESPFGNMINSLQNNLGQHILLYRNTKE